MIPSSDDSRSSTRALGGEVFVWLPRVTVSEINAEGNDSSIKRGPEAWQTTSKSAAVSVSTLEAPALCRRRMNCRPRVVEITKLVCDALDAVAFANTSNGSFGEYST